MRIYDKKHNPIAIQKSHGIIRKTRNYEAVFMKIIDIYTHVYPDPIAQKATDSIKDFYKLGGVIVPRLLWI